MPNNAIIIGNQGFVESAPERANDPRRGPSTTRKFKGTKTALLNLKTQFDSAKWTTRFTEGPLCTLEATIGADYDGTSPGEIPVDTWELKANVAEKDILQSDAAIVQSALSNESNAKILRDLNKGTRKFEDTSSGDFSNDASGADSVTIMLLLAGGLQSRIVFQPVVAHRQTVSNAYAVPASLLNVGSVLKTSTLITSEALPASIQNNLTASTSVTKSGLIFWYGWLKAYPTITAGAYQKTEISQEWQWGLWPVDLFTVI